MLGCPVPEPDILILNINTMAITIERDDRGETWSIPLFESSDRNWQRSAWMAEQLRLLADKIDAEKPSVVQVSLNTNSHTPAPTLAVRVVSKFDKAERHVLGWKSADISTHNFYNVAMGAPGGAILSSPDQLPMNSDE